jgi:hypothetical protein
MFSAAKDGLSKVESFDEKVVTKHLDAPIHFCVQPRYLGKPDLSGWFSGGSADNTRPKRPSVTWVRTFTGFNFDVIGRVIVSVPVLVQILPTRLTKLKA